MDRERERERERAWGGREAREWRRGGRDERADLFPSSSQKSPLQSNQPPIRTPQTRPKYRKTRIVAEDPDVGAGKEDEEPRFHGGRDEEGSREGGIVIADGLPYLIFSAGGWYVVGRCWVGFLEGGMGCELFFLGWQERGLGR